MLLSSITHMIEGKQDPLPLSLNQTTLERQSFEKLYAKSRQRRLLLIACAIAAICLLLVLGLELDRHILRVETYVESLGITGKILFVIAYAILCCALVPESLLGVIAGVAFGIWNGAAVVIVGSMLAVCLQYILAQRLFKSRIESVVAKRPALAAIASAVRADEWRLQFLIRLTPINRAVTSYALGAAGVAFVPFLLTCTGFIPNLFLEVWLGHAGKHLAHRAAGQGIGLQDIAMLAGLGMMVVVLLIVSRAAHRALQKAQAAAPLKG